MGPPHVCGGEIRTSLQHMLEPIRASMGPPHVCGGEHHFQGPGRELFIHRLQWGRRTYAAERRCGEGVTACSGVASMGPPHVCGGELPTSLEPPPKERIASMGPPHVCGGEEVVLVAVALAAVTASMGPPHVCGGEPRAQVLQAHAPDEA